MSASDSIEVSLARLDERTKTTSEDVAEIKSTMATKADQSHADRQIVEIAGLLAAERAERIASANAETKAREAAIASEKRERVAGDAAEATERKAVAGRLQTVEDRMEARKYNTAIAILMSVLGTALGVIALVFRPIFGG